MPRERCVFDCGRAHFVIICSKVHYYYVARWRWCVNSKTTPIYIDLSDDERRVWLVATVWERFVWLVVVVVLYCELNRRHLSHALLFHKYAVWCVIWCMIIIIIVVYGKPSEIARQQQTFRINITHKSELTWTRVSLFIYLCCAIIMNYI